MLFWSEAASYNNITDWNLIDTITSNIIPPDSGQVIGPIEWDVPNNVEKYPSLMILYKYTNSKINPDFEYTVSYNGKLYKIASPIYLRLPSSTVYQIYSLSVIV